MPTPSIQSLVESYQAVYEDYHPIYGRGGQKKRTETALEVLGKHANQRDKKRLHNIPKGGKTITDKDPYGDRLGTGEYDRGAGNASKRRAKGITKPKPNYFPNRLMRKDAHGIKDSYEYSDLVLDYLLDEGYANNEVSAEIMFEHMSDEWLEEILEGYKKLPKGKMIKKAATHGMKAVVNAARPGPAGEEGYEKYRNRAIKMADVADKHDPNKAIQKSDNNKWRGFIKRDADS